MTRKAAAASVLEVGFMSAHKQVDRVPWEKIVIALALLAAGAWILGWLAGKIVIFFVVK
jgi:hypothetical protein